MGISGLHNVFEVVRATIEKISHECGHDTDEVTSEIFCAKKETNVNNRHGHASQAKSEPVESLRKAEVMRERGAKTLAVWNDENGQRTKNDQKSEVRLPNTSATV